MAFSKITTRGMSGDTLEAGDIAANAIGASELADDAVDAGAIASGAVTAAKVADGLIEVKPHIKPGTLYPAWSGLLTDNTGHTFTDSSATPLTLTPKSGLHHSGVQKKVGTTSLRFDGSTSGLQINSSPVLGTGAFTIEFWLNVDSSQLSGETTYYIFEGRSDDNGDNSLSITMNDSDQLQVYNNTTDATMIAYHADTAVTAGTWTHVALVRESANVIKLYIGGVLKGTSANSDQGNMDNSGTSLFGIQWQLAQYEFTGYMDEIRITTGLAVYTGNFTPQTTALTTTWSAGTNIAANSTASNVKVLIHSDAGGHSGAYGTAQSDGLKYYYTDIKGSKPIKDPRIGAHFGGQRMQCTSVQSLEQETATHGRPVHSVDGREYLRVCGTVTALNDSYGNYLSIEDDESPMAFVEVVGYFNNANLSLYATTNLMAQCAVNGGSLGSNLGYTSIDSPLGGRHVHNGSLVNTGITATLGINTLRIEPYDSGGHNTCLNAVELIAQDTTSATTRSQIQIPAQNVVSYGKKFSVSATATHYDPFNGMSGAKTLSELGTYIDTATSLGMDNWKGGTSNYYKPFNGGRVVKWVNSSGTIKTSVTMMPPNAQNIGQTASNAVTNTEIQNSTNGETINFDTGGIDHSLTEVARTFHWREFGNGASNGGIASGTHSDATMLHTTADNFGFQLDDGVTGMEADNTKSNMQGTHDRMIPNADDTPYWFTFMGTGVSFKSSKTTGSANFNNVDCAQNLPYGTHTLKVHREDTGATAHINIDGIRVKTNADTYYGVLDGDITFYQPKMPPIPDDACIIADYILMPDFVGTAAGSIQEYVSKGVRYIHPTRDFLYDENCNESFSLTHPGNGGISARNGYYMGVSDVYDGVPTLAPYAQLPYFGTTVDVMPYADRFSTITEPINSTSLTTTAVSTTTWSGRQRMTGQTLGVNGIKIEGQKGAGTDANNFTFLGMEIATPTHTSSHYQMFETPFVYELIGGDRNMEQHNLVVTPDGKTWDEVTRDTSYISNTSLLVKHGTGGWTTIQEFINIRGLHHYLNMVSKEWTTAANRWICLVEGHYQMGGELLHRYSATIELVLNGNVISRMHAIADASDHNQHSVNGFNTIFHAKRGDTLYITGERHGALWSTINIKKLKKD